MRWLVLALLLGGCAPSNVHLPMLPGPADEVHCTMDRVGGSTEGVIECHVKQRYTMTKPGIF